MDDQKNITSYLFFIAEKYLSLRPRTEHELRFYLQRKIKKKYKNNFDLAEKITDEIIRDYKERNIINDKDFITWWVGERTYFKPRGRRALESELVKKGISLDSIKQYFEGNSLSETDMIIGILIKRVTPEEINDRVKRKKVTDHLLRKGFSYGDIKKAIEDFIEKE